MSSTLFGPYAGSLVVLPEAERGIRTGRVVRMTNGHNATAIDMATEMATE
ncbi:hypothetical protein [Actinopolymorpha rutila]|nr:hypothetical protein [Actinopolymorpha rutila]